MIVALLNYSVVQSFLGLKVSSHFTQEWGGEVRVGSMSVNLFDHVRVCDVLLVSPSNDTILSAERLNVRFDSWPIADDGLTLKRVYLKNASFHFQTDSSGNNLKYITSRYQKEEEEEDTVSHPFAVRVSRVVLNNVRYHHSLHADRAHRRYPVGVDIPNMDFSGVRARISGLCVEEGRITCRMERFSAHEASGLNIQRLDMDVDVGPTAILANNFYLQADSTVLVADLQLRYSSWKSMRHYCDSVNMYALFKPGTDVSMATPAYWAPVLWGMDSQVRLVGRVVGPVANLQMDDLVVRFGHGSEIVLDGSVVGLPHIDSTVFNVDVEHLTTNYADLASVRHPERFQVRVLPLFRQMGAVDIEASFLGTIRDFNATAMVNSALGVVDASAAMSYDKSVRSYSYNVEASSSSFQLAKVVPNEWVSTSGFRMTASGKGFDPHSMKATAEGTLFNSVFRGVRLAETSFDADVSNCVLTAALRLADTLASVRIDTKADWSGDNVLCSLSGDVGHIDLRHLRLWGNESDSVMTLSSHIAAQASWPVGDTDIVNHLVGSVDLTSTHVCRNQDSATFDNVSVDLSRHNQRKQLVLNSDVADVTASGYFDYADLGLMLRQFCDQYLPIYYNPYKDMEAVDNASISSTDVSLDLEWKDAQGKSAIWLPSLSMADGTQLHCNYTFAQSLKAVLKSDSLRLGGVTVYDIGMDGSDVGGRYVANVEFDHVSLGGSELLENVFVKLASSFDRLSCALHWFTPAADTTRGDILLLMTSDTVQNNLSVVQSNILFHGNHWTIQDEAGITFAKQLFSLPKVLLRSQDQSLLVQSHIAHRPNDYLNVTLQDFGLEQFAFLTAASGFDLDGSANGQFSMYGFGEVPYFNAALTIADFVVNDQPMGDAKIRSNWNAELNQLNIDLSTELSTEAGTREPLSASGYVTLGGESRDLDLAASFDGFSLQSVAPLVKSFASQLEGSLHGDLEIGGTLDNPLVNGDAYVSDGSIVVDFLNTSFTIDDSIAFTNDRILFDNFVFRDARGHPAYLNGSIGHHNLKNLLFDLSLRSDDLLIMNTTAQQGDFYGRVCASANGRITGNDRNMDIVVDARTNTGSNITFPINNKRQMKELNYIRFVSDDYFADWRGEQHRREVRPPASFSYHLTINLDVTPDVHVSLPMDFSTLGASVSATGQGALQLTMSTDEPFAVQGNYELDNGTMALNLLDVITKSFSIAQGSSINFTGDILDAIFDLEAVYSQRVNMATLTGVSAVTDRSQQNIPVQNVIALSGTLQNPEIGFDIRLPNVDQSVQEEVFSYIDRTNDRDMLNQTVNLLVFGQFYNSAVSNGSTTANSGYNVVANSVGSLVSDMVQFVDVNFDYSAATELTNQQIDVDISKEWGKFYLESSVGIGSDNFSESDNDNNLTGDVLLGYKIRPNIHFFVFNRSNTNDYTRSDLPYKQGLGLKYTKDFDHWRDLFRKKKKIDR